MSAFKTSTAYWHRAFGGLSAVIQCSALNFAAIQDLTAQLVDLASEHLLKVVKHLYLWLGGLSLDAYTKHKELTKKKSRTFPRTMYADWGEAGFSAASWSTMFNKSWTGGPMKPRSQDWFIFTFGRRFDIKAKVESHFEKLARCKDPYHSSILLVCTCLDEYSAL